MEVLGPRQRITWRLRRGQLVALDFLAVAFASVLLLLVAGGRSVASGAAMPLWPDYVLLAATAVRVTVRLLWPLPVFVIALAVSLLSLIPHGRPVRGDGLCPLHGGDQSVESA